FYGGHLWVIGRFFQEFNYRFKRLIGIMHQLILIIDSLKHGFVIGNYRMIKWRQRFKIQILVCRIWKIKEIPKIVINSAQYDINISDIQSLFENFLKVLWHAFVNQYPSGLTRFAQWKG